MSFMYPIFEVSLVHWNTAVDIPTRVTLLCNHYTNECDLFCAFWAVKRKFFYISGVCESVVQALSMP